MEMEEEKKNSTLYYIRLTALIIIALFILAYAVGAAAGLLDRLF
jgi:hypothetical protein